VNQFLPKSSDHHILAGAHIAMSVPDESVHFLSYSSFHIFFFAILLFKGSVVTRL